MTSNTDDGRRVVARFLDGRILKGSTHDFAPNKPRFHVSPGGNEAAKPVDVSVADLKALFFVKSWEGNARRVRSNDFSGAVGQGRRVKVTFVDGEVLAGFTMGYAPDKPGFFLIPVDPGGNNSRVFVVLGSVEKVEWVTASTPLVGTGRPAGGRG